MIQYRADKHLISGWRRKPWTRHYHAIDQSAESADWIPVFFKSSSDAPPSAWDESSLSWITNSLRSIANVLPVYLEWIVILLSVVAAAAAIASIFTCCSDYFYPRCDPYDCRWFQFLPGSAEDAEALNCRTDKLNSSVSWIYRFFWNAWTVSLPYISKKIFPA